MQPLSLNDIREQFLEFFKSKDHLALPSFPLVPKNDPSVLLINAGMTPMKPWFTGAATPPSRRVATCQKCIRTPDIESVGKTARHGTYFEMLGNFSFGDYFKEEAIGWAWEFSVDVLGMPADRLYVTVHEEDDEAYRVWHEVVGLDASHIKRQGKDNFWEHGVGPCGPCSELFFDRGEAFACDRPDCGVGCECDRYVEFWNLVFTQFFREEDGSYSDLTQRNIDTGAGLERVAAIMQGVDNIFEVDTVRAILDTVCEITGMAYGRDHGTDVALRVITDHVRSSMMMIADGVIPGNEGRGYVLRRLIRRAIRYGRLLGVETPFMADVMRVALAQSDAFYPELRDAERILTTVTREEARFHKTLRQGLDMLRRAIEASKAKGRDTLDGAVAFRLHDTYGFPYDLTREIAGEAGLGTDQAGFDAMMTAQKQRARRAFLEKTSTAWDNLVLPDEVKSLGATPFVGYDCTDTTAEVRFLLKPQADVPEPLVLSAVEEGDEGLVILDRTPFYAESGGQIGDHGRIRSSEGEAMVLDTEKTEDDLVLHHVRILSGTLAVGAEVTAEVAVARRRDTARNHTATHLLHKALRAVLGNHVEQRGSLVTPDRLRFDFRHDGPVSAEQIEAVERLVNEKILANLPVTTEEMSQEAARGCGAVALFDERYGERVRVVSVGDFSKEFCGGTHVGSTGEISSFRVMSEGGVAAGVRRIEAITGRAALARAHADRAVLRALEPMLRTNDHDAFEACLAHLLEEKTALQKRAERAEMETIQAAGKALTDEAETINGLSVIMQRVEDMDAKALRAMGDRLRDRLGAAAVILLVSVNGGQLLWLAMAGKEAVAAGVKAGDLVRQAAEITGGRGGGRPDMAQAGGKDATKIEAAFAACRERLAP